MFFTLLYLMWFLIYSNKKSFNSELIINVNIYLFFYVHDIRHNFFSFYDLLPSLMIEHKTVPVGKIAKTSGKELTYEMLRVI